MKIKIVCILLCIVLVLTALPMVCSEQVIKNEKGLGNNLDTYLLNTKWGQHGGYKSKCPVNKSNNNISCRLGCWSVAIGQIVNFHQLQSHGFVHYECSYFNISPKIINNNLDEHFYVWTNMPFNLSGASPDEKDNVSQLLFDVATVIQKDFGTGSYVILGDTFDVDAMMDELRAHIDYISIDTEWDDNLTEPEIVDEINNNRPIMFYIRNVSSAFGEKSYHAVALDGYRRNPQGGAFQVHLNYGWDADNPDPINDSWYNYHDPFPHYNDVSFRMGMLIKLAPNIPVITGQTSGIPGQSYEFEAVTTSYNNLDLSYKWEWGDGTETEWMGLYRSGEPCEASHTWKEKGTYNIRVKAKDVNDAESDWGYLEVTMPKEKQFHNIFFQKFLQRFPNMFPLLRFLLGL